jgi:hypothetical protein
MQVDFYGLHFDTTHVTFYLWSPWRASSLENRMFESLTGLPGVALEKEEDEVRLHVRDTKTWKAAMLNLTRILKGWQEEAEQGRERRAWRWLLEGDTDDHGYDHAGEPASIWGYLQLGLERGNFEEPEKMETVDLNAIGLRVWPHKEKT